LNGDGSREYPEELSEAASLKFLKAFEANLGAADKALRLVTLGILSHFEPLPLSGHDPVQGQTKQQKTDDAHPREESQHKSQVCAVNQTLAYKGKKVLGNRELRGCSG
jgi:hypothetical protein